MDKSVNNFDDVDDTMSSVYNAWRKKLSRNILIANKEKIYTQISLSISLTPLSVILCGFFTHLFFSELA